MSPSDSGSVEDVVDADLFAVDKVDFLESKDPLSSEKLQQALEALKKRERNDVKCKAYRRLIKIVENILLQPWDHQKRRIRKSNPVYETHIARDKHMVDVLEALGFIHLNGFVVMQVVRVPELRNSYRQLIAMLREEYGIEVKSLEGHFFDPFKAYMHDSNVNKNWNKEDFEIHGVDLTKLQIQELSHKLSDVDNETNLSHWNPRITIQGAKMASRRQSSAGNSDTKEAGHTASHLMKIYGVGKWDKFESVSKKQLDEIKKEYEHLEKRQSVELKIKLPADTTLMLEPPMKTPVAKLKSEIQSMILDSISVDSWNLLEMPTRRALDETKTLIQQGISHKVILHLHLKNGNKPGWQIIKPVFLKKFQTVT